MHNVQHLKHQETQTIYPSTGYLRHPFLSLFHTDRDLTADIQFTRINLSIPFSLTTHTCHKTSSSGLLLLSLSLSLGDSRTSCQIDEGNLQPLF
ncbi:hypothetical protein Hanom_Chr02g00177641 [Helianthus anomalus]